MPLQQVNCDNIIIPSGFILFISGVPGVGKTTVSYELLKKYNNFRIIEETDILREAFRGYNAMLLEKYGQPLEDILHHVEISDHTKLLTYKEAMQQCLIMRKSIENIVARQQRKGIASIINGVHIIPEVFQELMNKPNILFINLYVSNENILHERIYGRDPQSYMLQHISFIYQNNMDLFRNIEKLAETSNNKIFNIDVATLDIDKIIHKIIECIVSSTN